MMINTLPRWNKNNTKTNKKRLHKILLILSVIVMAGICSRFFFQLMLIQGKSMEPSYHHMQLVILDKTDRQFQHGDVIAFRCDKLSSVLVKRIVACPGESTVIQNGILYVDEQRSNRFPMDAVFDYAGLLEEKTTLKEGQYIVIGDNIAESKDSRYSEIGIIEEKDIIGKVR